MKKKLCAYQVSLSRVGEWWDVLWRTDLYCNKCHLFAHFSDLVSQKYVTSSKIVTKNNAFRRYNKRLIYFLLDTKLTIREAMVLRHIFYGPAPRWYITSFFKRLKLYNYRMELKGRLELVIVVTMDHLWCRIFSISGFKQDTEICFALYFRCLPRAKSLRNLIRNVVSSSIFRSHKTCLIGATKQKIFVSKMKWPNKWCNFYFLKTYFETLKKFYLCEISPFRYWFHNIRCQFLPFFLCCYTTVLVDR